MADPTGTIYAAHDGKTYALRLTMAGLAQAQERHPDAMAAMLGGEGTAPSLSLCLLLVSLALQKAERMPMGEADDLADELFTADQSVVQRLLAAAFPDTEAGNAPKKPKAKG